MNKYELALVISSKVEDEVREATLERAKEIITRFGGENLGVDDWGKRRLAYEVQKMNEAFYYFISFEGDSECPAEIESRVRILDNVIRYLVVKRED